MPQKSSISHSLSVFSVFLQRSQHNVSHVLEKTKKTKHSNSNSDVNYDGKRRSFEAFRSALDETSSMAVFTWKPHSCGSATVVWKIAALDLMNFLFMRELSNGER